MAGDSLEQFLKRFEEEPIFYAVLEIPYKLGNDFSIICGMAVHAGTDACLEDAIREHGDFTAKSTFSTEPKEALFRVVRIMLTNMHLIATHDLCWPILVCWRDICRDATIARFKLGFLQSHIRELVSLLYARQYREARFAILETQLQAYLEERQRIDDMIASI